VSLNSSSVVRPGHGVHHLPSSPAAWTEGIQDGSIKPVANRRRSVEMSPHRWDPSERSGSPIPKVRVM